MKTRKNHAEPSLARRWLSLRAALCCCIACSVLASCGKAFAPSAGSLDEFEASLFSDLLISASDGSDIQKQYATMANVLLPSANNWPPLTVMSITFIFSANYPLDTEIGLINAQMAGELGRACPVAQMVRRRRKMDASISVAILALLIDENDPARRIVSVRLECSRDDMAKQWAIVNRVSDSVP